MNTIQPVLQTIVRVQQRMKPLTNKEFVLLSALRSNARQTLTQISKKTRIPISTLHDQLKNQEKTIIRKYVALIDFAQLGFYTKIHLQLKVTPEMKPTIEKHLQLHENVNSLCKIAHGFDFFVEAVFERVDEVETFIASLQKSYGMTEYNVNYITKDIKREGFLNAS